MPPTAAWAQKSPVPKTGGKNVNSQKPGQDGAASNILPGVAAPPRVLIVDRDSMSSDLIAGALSMGGPFQAEAVSAANLLDRLSRNHIAVVVIGSDVDSTSGKGFDLLYRVSCSFEQTHFVVLLNSITHGLVINAFRSGARGVFSRQQPMSDLIHCVDHVRKGFIWAGPECTNFLLDTFKSVPAPTLIGDDIGHPLTTRELQVVQCAAKGLTNRAIASALSLSEHTVKNYLFRAFEKLGVSSRVELLFYLTLRGYNFGPKQLNQVDTDAGDD